MRHYILADNQELTHYAIRSLLERDESNSVRRAVDKTILLQLLKEHEDSVVILDYTLFDFSDAESLLIASERFSMTSWILLSEELSGDFLRKIIYSTHAFSVVFKNEPFKSIRDAIQYASEGKRYVSQYATEKILVRQQDDMQADVLTATELEIVKAIARGKTTKEIAEDRFSSIHTITTHRKNIFRKLGVNTAHEATKYAIRAGWVDTSEFYI